MLRFYIHILLSVFESLTDCKKFMLKSSLKEYLQVDDDGTSLIANGKSSNVRSSFFIHQINKGSVNLQSLPSGKYISTNDKEFELIEVSNGTLENQTVFTILPQLDGTFMLENLDNKFVFSDDNGLVEISDSPIDNGTWKLECLEGNAILFK